MMKFVSIAVVGCGPMGREHLRAILGAGGAEVQALCDLREDAMDAAVEIIKQPTVRRFTNYYQMLSEVQCDGVVVAVPQNLHEEYSVAALEAGCAVFCEKPMALTVDGCRRMITTAERVRQPLMIGQVLRYLPPYRHLLELVGSGALGKARAVRIIRSMGHWRPEHNPWRCTRAEAGGLLYEVNIHEIDFMLCLLGRARRVSAQGGRLINLRVEYEDHMSVGIEFDDGAVGHVTSSICDFWGRNAGEIFCERGTIYYDSLTCDVRIGRPDGSMETVAFSDIGRDWEPGVQREIREFVEACRGDAGVTIPGIEGLRAVAVCQAAYESVALAKPVDLPRD